MQPTALQDDPRFPDYQRASFPDGSSMLVPRAAGTSLLGAGSRATAQASPNMTLPPPNASMAPPGGQAPSPPPVVQDFTPAQPQPQAPPTFQVAPQPERRAVDPMDPRTGLHLSDYREANRPIYVPGRPAVDPRKIVASQVPVPVHRTTQTTQGPGYDPEAVARYQELEQKAALAHGEAQMLDAHNREQVSQMTASSLAELQAKQQAEQYAAESFYRTNMTALESEARQIAATKIDPDQASRGMSGWQTIGLAIAAGLAGKANPTGQNQVLNLISQKIDRNIAAQEMNLRNRKDVNQSALGRMAQQWGSIEAGRAALKVREFEIAKAKLEATAAQMGLPAEHAKVQGLLLGLDAAQAKERMMLQQAARGQSVTSEQSGFMVPQKAQPGYYRNPSDKEYEARVDRTQARAVKGGEIVGKGLENLEKQGELAGEIPGKASSQVTQYGEKRAEIMDTINMARQFMERNGVTKDKDGNWVPTKGIPGIGFGTAVYPESFDTDAGQTNLQQVRQIGAMGAKAIYGILTATEKASFAEDFLPISNEKRLVKGVGSIIDKAEAKLKDLDASYGQQPVQEFERRRATMGAAKGARRQGISEPE